MNLEKLFKHLADENGLLLVESEKREIADCLHEITYATYKKYCPRKCLLCGNYVDKDLVERIKP
jgi:hypothetical protein